MFQNLRFLAFFEHFRQLREKYAIKSKIKYIMLIRSLWSSGVARGRCAPGGGKIEVIPKNKNRDGLKKGRPKNC